ncbi:hypothetical protein H072_4162 [Dactylellina haptotyla CBS 200.50]|uniref:Copper acquisition factor BIM1-like domain-containing protein n=1 Tax=Dactylellina haptotyla (strain CBS 200.50) TaxID=1284197 RepID=S8ALC7_DACHA|nr:hypothetical protein H072_4162 [Dactylellina haptotyla CBS 200.50]
MRAQSLLLSLLAASTAHAHFTLRNPEPLGKSAAKQDTGPCGGYTVDENTPITEFHVDGEAIAYSSSHPEVHVLFRVVEGNKADGSNLQWSQVFPIVEQYGSGDFCEPMVTAPRSLVGKQGIFQVVQNAVDGMLYACAYVKFVSGSVSPLPDSCKNGTGVDAAISSDPTLEALMGNTPTTGSQTTSAPSATNTPSQGTTRSFSLFAGVVGAAVAVVFGGL